MAKEQEIIDAEKRGYAKGYSAGKKFKQRFTDEGKKYKQDSAYLDRLYLALLPVALSTEWSVGEEKIVTMEKRISLAARFAREALKQRPLP